MGEVYLALGEIDTAFDWYDRAIDEHDGKLLGGQRSCHV
jgi:hypothetical protein